MSWYGMIILVALCLPIVIDASLFGSQLVKLCRNQHVSLDSIHQTRQLIEQVKSDHSPESCTDYRNALLDLEIILVVVQSGKTSNLEFVKLVREYHEKYIATKANQFNGQIPVALRQFFMSLCFQISADLKKVMINSLELDSKEYVEEEDYRAIGMIDLNGKEDGTTLNDFDDIVLLEDITKLSTNDQTQATKILIKMRTSEVLRLLIATCNNKFRPIYEKLILPLIGLSDLGYNYKGELLKKELEYMRESELVKNWYSIVQICETFRSVEIFEAPVRMVNSNHQAFILITPEEAQKLRGTHRSLTDPLADERINYEPIVKHEDTLWIKDQKELHNLIKKYKASATDTDRIKARVFKMFMKQLVDSLKSGKFLCYTSEVIKGTADGHSITNVNEELIKIVDSATFDPSEKLDQPVSGFALRKNAEPLIPPKIPYSPPKEVGTEFFRRLRQSTYGRYIPSRINIFFWIIGTIGLLLLILQLTPAAG